jgi:hypothetical protein
MPATADDYCPFRTTKRLLLGRWGSLVANVDVNRLSQMSVSPPLHRLEVAADCGASCGSFLALQLIGNRMPRPAQRRQLQEQLQGRKAPPALLPIPNPTVTCANVKLFRNHRQTLPKPSESKISPRYPGCPYRVNDVRLNLLSLAPLLDSGLLVNSRRAHSQTLSSTRYPETLTHSTQPPGKQLCSGCLRSRCPRSIK